MSPPTNKTDLNAAAASFSPAAGRMMDDIDANLHENEVDDLVASMNNNGIMNTTSTSSEAALPSHLVKHAAEFWFPECRDCACCKGYKFGCPNCCATKEYCSACCGNEPPPPIQAQSQSPAQCTPAKPSLCKFYASPSGCRFGDKCRFTHAS
eukprot:CAMPEP_0194218604 /NCGR_PEP_ID=MMETSP0156-20130528/24135_1 /TAXON_ID=33649 /ORGANISM="Thalassionema nitzschioides, Strain L26-B" /LENGTH=151 /DNA_ID=CAMNT_0038948015 /DNA_START=221 /DNA_END=676 /DNA_ORIENTATION=+